MSWSEFKKKKEQDEYENSISSSKSKSINKSSETETISSWQKFKEEKENKDKQSNYKNSENKKEDKKTILDDIGYTAKSLGAGIIGGLTGLAKAGTTEIQNELQKGADEKKSVLDNIKDIIGVTQKISNPLSTLPKTAIDNFISAKNTFTDKDSTPFEKLINHVNNSVTSALDTALPFKGAIDETIQMIGSLNPNAKDKIKNIDEKISTPYNNLQKSLSEESQKYNSITQMAGNVANVAGNMVPSIAATAITKNPSIGLVTMGISAKGQATQEALDKGADLDKAVKIGNTKGMIEIGTEMLSGGVNIFGKGALDDIVEKGLISKVKNKVGKVLAKEGYDFAGEVGEEVISDVLGTLIDKGTVDSNAKYTISDFGDTAITTILSTAVLKAIGIPLNKLNNQNLKTENEQKVYDNELGTRISEKTKESTIDNAYNKQLDIKKNLGIEITDDVKKETMQKVKNAYENGTLNVTELSKQEKDKIQKQLDIDFEDGNISTDKIKQILGENIDLSNDKYLMKSMYENEQKFNTYEVTKTNNEKVDILLQSAADAGMNNTTKTRRKIELISKLVADTNKQYKFVSPEQLKQLGYNENANGLIDKSTGNILINAHSDNGIQSIIGHETTHIFDGKNENGEYSKEYQTLQDMAIEYAKTKGIYDSKIKNITDSYGDLLADESQIKEELTADLVGDFLFNDEHFIENLAVKNKNIFQKIYDYVKHAYKMITSKTDEAKALENLKYQFDKVYNSVFETNDTETRYSIAGKQGMLNAIKSDTQNLELERNYNKAQQMQENGIDNETIRQNTGWFQDRNGDWKFEFTDKYMSLKNINFKENKTYKLGDILEHDILFTAYPELADYNVKFEKMDTSGAFRKTENLIRINTNKLNAKNSKVAIEGTMIHEIQHAIQSIEGFEEGKGSRFKLAYYESLGEIEADNTKKRYILEKNGKLDRNSVKPESSKNNPQHSNLNNYLKNRKLLDKIKDSVYNYYNNKYKKSGDSYEIYQKDLEQNNEESSKNIFQNGKDYNRKIWNRLENKKIGENVNEIHRENLEQNNHENSSLGFERTNRNRRSDGTLGNRGNENRKNGRKNGEKIQEANPQLQIQSEKIRKATYKNKEKNNIKVWNDGILEESENNSGSFSFDKNAKRYEDLQEANTVKFNKRVDGTINIEISDNNELINQFTVTSKDNALKQLGNDIANYIYDNATEDSKTINLKQHDTVDIQDTSHKGKQLEIIKSTNPMLDDYHVGIRNIEDIKTFDEVINDDGESFAWGDFSKEDAEKALKDGKVTVYSSYPIKQGTFVSTSRIQAEEYAGGRGNRVYSKTIPLDSVAWINGDEGQYANINQRYSLTDSTISGDDIAVKDMLKQNKVTLEDEVGNTKQSNQNTTITVEDMLNQTPEEKQQRMKDKAEKYLSRSKTQFINKIVNDFGTSKIANTKTLNSVVNSIREDIQRNETLTNEKRTSYFNDLYDNLIKIDTQYYDTYKEVKENILNTKLYVSDAIRNNITDYNDFRKNHIGSIIMTNDKSNISVESYYQELSDSYPELFPTNIINPADQLQRIADVSKDIAKVETNVAAYNDKYLGKDYRTWAKMEFDKDIDTFTNNIKLAERYNNESNEKQKLNIDKESIKNVYKQLPDARRNYEKVSSKELLTKEDRVQVDRLLNNEISIQEIPKGLNTEGIIKVAESKMEYDSLQKAIKEYQTEIKKARIEEARNDIGNLDLWKDKNIGFKYSRETPIRNIYDVAPKDIADNIVNKYFRSYIEVNEKKVVDSINEYNERIRKLDIGTKKEYTISYTEDQNGVEVTVGPQKVSESTLVQLLGEKKITPDALYSAGVDVTKIEKAVDEFRNVYEELIKQINESMLDNGYAPVEHRKDYFPHFTEEKADTLLGKAAKLLGIDITNREELPTDIAGQTYQFKPGRTWFSNILERTSNVTDYDALKGFDKYIRGATDLIYHTGDIQNLRALSTAIKGSYNDVEIQNRIEEIKESSMSDIEKADAIQEIYSVAKDKSHLSKFIEWLDNYTNLLAGKKAINDRGAEKELNRQVYKTMQDVESRIAANAIGGNVGVSLTNFAVISQAWGEVRTSNLINGVWQTMKASLGKDSSFASESQFITRRKGADALIETTLDKVTKPINAVLDFADNFSSEVIVRAKYNQNLQEGMNTEQALQEADRYTASLMADRGRGALPTQFNNKNPIAKMMNMFQVEVNNQWSYYFKDLPRNIQQKANGNKAEIVANTAMAYTKIMVGAYLTNELLESIRGNSTRVLPDPIYIVKELLNRLTDDDDDNDDDAIIGTLTEIAGNLPFISLPATLLADSLGLDVADIGRISISGAIPNVANIISDTSDMIHGSKTIGEGAKSIGSELLDTVGASLVLPYGGSQLKKTAKGLAMYLNDVPGNYTKNGDLRYTVDDNLLRKVQAGIFGAYANPYAQDYTDSGYKAIDQDDMAEMLDLNMNSSEYRKYKSGLSKAQKTVDKNGYKQYNDDSGNIYWYDSKKGIMYDSSYKKTNLTKDDLTKSVKTQEALNYINSLDLTNSQKNIAANDLTKNSKKTIDMKEYGKYSSYEEYKYARDYPEKYSIITQITDYDTYLKYKEDISDIKKKYKIETEHDSNLRKKEIRNYINNLDLNKTQKILLEKMAGGYGITNYKGTIHNYLDTTNLSQDEKYKIWKELFD